jgi:uncharacterized membrane protein
MMLGTYLLVAIIFFSQGIFTSTYLYVVDLLLFVFLDYITTFLVHVHHVLTLRTFILFTDDIPHPQLGVPTYILTAMSIDAV